MISARSLFRPLLPLRRPGRDWTAATDAELALAARDRDRAGKDAFVEIVRRHQAAVSAVAYSVTGRIGLTDDIAQETFLNARSFVRISAPPYSTLAGAVFGFPGGWLLHYRT